MNYFLTRANKAATLVLTGLIAVQAVAHPYFSSEDQTTIQQWVRQAGFIIYSTNNQNLSTNELSPDTLFTLQALHESRPEPFYRYLARLIIRAQLSDSELTSLLKSKFALNKTQNHFFETYIIERNEVQLADWLNRYMKMKSLFDHDENFYTDLFQLLTSEVISRIQDCPEIAMLKYFNGIKEKRRTIVQCIAPVVDVNMIDIDISQNRVITAKILGAEPISPDKALPSPTVLDNSELHFASILNAFHDPQIRPVILLTTSLSQGFIAPLVKKTMPASKKIDSPPIKKTSKKKISLPSQQRIKYQRPRKDNHTTFSKSPPPHWPASWFEFWIKSPGYSIAAYSTVGIAITLFVIYFPYPGNLF